MKICNLKTAIFQFYIKFCCLFIFDREKRRNKRFVLSTNFGTFDRIGIIAAYKSLHAKYSGLVKNAKNIRQVVIGSSRTRMGILPFLLGEDTYNYAQDGFGMYESYCQLQDVIKICPNLKRVIVDVAFYSGGWWVLQTKDIHLCRLLAKKLNYSYDFDSKKQFNFKRLDKIIDNLPKIATDCCQGYDFPLGIFPDNKALSFVKSHMHLAKSYTNQWVHLENICKLCKEHNIELIMVRTPVNRFYIEETEKMGGMEQYIAPAYDIAKRYNVKLLNITEGFEEEDFFNSYHLNFNGAAKYTRRLAKLLNEPTSIF